ncbi:MAG: T9SS type A sorting domain-containing protein [Bacteroidetes bacterium]|nr:T9SS type A sorting domain-containing protein [Bacteroidota bacterium]
MRNALASGTSGRSNLSTLPNLGATDVNGTLPCPPIAEFMSTTNYTVCSGGSLNFKDLSYNGTISSYAWSADNGAILANPTNSTTAITFPTQGVSSVTLTVTNGQGSSTKIKTVTVLNGTAVINGNYTESFENAGVPANWSVVNVGGGVTWDQTTVAAKDGSGSFFLDGTQSTASQQDILVMPIMDVVNNPSNLLTFSYAYARQTATHADKLVLQGSLDCGGSWIDVVSLNASTMASGSGGTTSSPFIPVPANWKDVDVTSYPYWFNFANSQSATFRFVFTEDATTGNGNRLFIDAVNFQNPNGLNELTKNYRLNLFPNPSTGETNLKFNLNDAANVTVNVVDMLGKNVLPATTINYNAGEQTIAINKNASLSKGIYFVNISINGAKMSKKLVIN